MKTKNFVTLLAAVIASSSAWAGVPSGVVLNQIHHINEKEIQCAQAALAKAQTQDVRDFAQHMIDQHTDADAQVKNLASSEGVTLAAFQPADFEKVASDDLAQMQGAKYDHAYMAAMDSGHKEALFVLDSAEKSTKDDQLKALIKKLRPTVKEHEKMAAKLKEKLKKDDSST